MPAETPTPLPACPFCGGECDPAGWYNATLNKRGPLCESCGATAPDAAAWSRRVTPDAGVREALADPHNPTPRLYVGSMNDSLYIIDKPPSPSNTDVGPWVSPNGPKIVIPCGVNAELANKLVQSWNAIVDARAALASTPTASGYQARVNKWMLACFGEVISADAQERNHRFLEEALELVQSGGCTASEAHQLVDYVYGRPVGEMGQEVGGVMVTLAAFCTGHDVSLDAEAERELTRIWTKVESIRAKQAAKPRHSPLPALASTPPQVTP